MTDTIVTNVDTAVIEDTNINADAATQLATLQAEVDAKNKLIEKLRTQEKHNQTLAKEAGAKTLEEALRNLQLGATKDAEDWKNKYEQLNTEHVSLKDGLKQKQLETSLKEVLSNANLKDVNTALKIIDKTQIQWTEDGQVDTTSITAIVEQLKTTDPILFNELLIPDVKQAGNGTPTGGYEKEIMAARSQKDVQAIMRKYNKI